MPRRKSVLVSSGMRSAILVSLLFLLGYAGCLRAAATSVVAPTEAAKRVADGKAVLIDVREPAEWAETGVAAPAALLPRRCSRGAAPAQRPQR